MTTRYRTVQVKTAAPRTAPRPARRHTRRRARRRHPFRLLFVLFLLGAAIWFAPRAMCGGAAVLRWQREGVDVQSGTAAAIFQLSMTDSRADEILQHPENYPPRCSICLRATMKRWTLCWIIPRIMRMRRPTA